MNSFGIVLLGYNRAYIAVLAGSGDRPPGICHKYREAAAVTHNFICFFLVFVVSLRSALLNFQPVRMASAGRAEGKRIALFRGKSGRFLIRIVEYVFTLTLVVEN